MAWPTRFTCGVLLLFVGLTVSPDSVSADEIGFVEDFALAPDRSVPLGQLIPGTEQYYYFHCLNYQHLEQFENVEKMLAAWIKRYNVTPLVREIQTRQALLTYPANPRKSLEYIRQQLGLQFHHQREQSDENPNLPTRLEPGRISRQALTEIALKQHRNLNGFTTSALDWLVTSDLSPEKRRHLLQRLQRPDHDGLVKLVIDDLNLKDSGGFGSLKIHGLLLKSQLDECLKLKSDLRNQSNFVNTYLKKLRPSEDVNWQTDADQRLAYLEDLWSFVGGLAPVHNSLKAHVLYHRLRFDRSQGIHDSDRFLAYIKLPRNAAYVNREYLNRDENRRFIADLNTDFQSVTLMPVVGDDSELVSGYLLHFLEKAADYKSYVEYISDGFLKQHFAEAKIVNGLGDGTKWSSMLTPGQFQALKDRVDLDFAAERQTIFAAADQVGIDLYVKNVSTLIVKVYEIQTRNYYREQAANVSSAVSLDGLVPNWETTYQYDDPPLRRVRRHFDFPRLGKRGVYVVDFIGNGKSSRAVIQKGQLRYSSEITTAGHILSVMDENLEKLKDARIWLAGREYTANDQGDIVVPFSNQPGTRSMVLSHGNFSSLATFFQNAESYQLRAGLFVDRESLVAGNKARLLVRPGLYLNNVPVTLSVLEDIRLAITATDQDGVDTTTNVADFMLYEDRDTEYEFHVPPRLASIRVRLTARVQNLSRNKKEELTASTAFAVNAIDQSDKVVDLHFGRAKEGYFIELLGRNGEPKSDRAVPVTLEHRDFSQSVHVSLQTDKHGRIELGPLTGIDSVTATTSAGTKHTWKLQHHAHGYYQNVNASVGETIQLPYVGRSAEPSRDELSLLEIRGGTFYADRFSAIEVDKGSLLLQGLPAGDHDLLLKQTGKRVRIRVTDGPTRGNHIWGKSRRLEVRGPRPMVIDSVTVNQHNVRIQLRNASKFTRVHVFATRYQPAYGPFREFAQVGDVEPTNGRLGTPRSFYVEGRNLGDEYRYIIDRQYAEKFPGNLLERPSLLLNPWPIRQTQTESETVAPGDNFAPSEDAPDAERPESQTDRAKTAAADSSAFANLDFLSDGSAVATNLQPDEKGTVEMPADAFDGYQQIHVLAIDPLSTAYRSAELDASALATRDIRFADGLDTDGHFAQQKQVSMVQAEEQLVIDNIAASRFEVYDTLAKVFHLYSTLSDDSRLAEFEFVTRWNNMKPEERFEKYSKYASHELNFFLYHKDPIFFEANVRPFLQNKKDKTFLDDWLLDAKLDRYLGSWRYAQLNTVERILLSQRIPADRRHAARLIEDRLAAMTPDMDRLAVLFETAIQSSALEFDEELLAEVAEQKKHLKDGLLILSGERLGKVTKSVEQLDEEVELRVQDDSAANGIEKLFEGGNLFRKNQSSANDRDVLQRQLKADYYFDKNADLRGTARQHYQKLDKTQQWVENHYYRLPIEQQNGDLIRVNRFWKDFVRHGATAKNQEPFRSPHLAEASRNFSEIMLAMAVLDLPFTAGEHQRDFENGQMTLTAASPLIAFHEEIKPVESAGDDNSILISQNFFRHGDRFRHEGNLKLDKFVTDEFLAGAVYGCQVVVTNPSSTPRKLTALTQIPSGAVPVLGGRETHSRHIDSQPYATTKIEYFFYFPSPGKYPQFPAHVSHEEKLLASAKPVSFNVVAKLTRQDRRSWQYLSQHGSNKEVLDFLAKENLFLVDTAKIAFRMHDAEFFRQVARLLAARHWYDHTLWSYSIKHNEVSEIREYLQHAEKLVQQCGAYLDSPLVTIDPVARRSYEHMDYRPLVNARAHQLGARRQILNDRFFEQYHRLMNILSHRRELDDAERMTVTYYLLLQDRVEEALAQFSQINPQRLHTRLQYDYFAAYLDFFKARPTKARDIASKYTDHPVQRWRKAFAAMLAQLDEIENGEPATIDPENRTQRQTELASTEPSFEFAVEARQIKLKYQNLARVRVNYYEMDIELLFSRNPFVQQFAGQFSFIRPNATATIDLEPMSSSHTIVLPKQFHNSNVLVEITGAGITKSETYYANSLALQVVENYGQLRVAEGESNKPLPKVYIKVYARLSDGSVRFYKDGYSDLRGRFDYSSLNTNQLDQVQRFALLIMSSEHGAVVREAAPPKR